MTIAILSDTHDNLANIKKLILFLKKNKIRILIHCGDITNLNTIKVLRDPFFKKIYFVLSEIDKSILSSFHLALLKRQKKIKIFSPFGIIKVKNTKIGFTHLPYLAYDLSKTEKCDIIFYGHTHKPWEEKKGKCLLINPGNLAGILYPATFALYDLKRKKAELKILDKLE